MYTTGMNQAAETLVIANSVVLVIFLVLGIVVLIQTILLMRHVKHLVEKAEDAAEAVESMGRAFQSAAMPFGISKLLHTVLRTFTTNNKRSSKK